MIATRWFPFPFEVPVKIPDEDAFDQRHIEQLEDRGVRSFEDAKHWWETKTILAIVVILWANAILRFFQF